jgi:hypothetical protein
VFPKTQCSTHHSFLNRQFLLPRLKFCMFLDGPIPPKRSPSPRVHRVPAQRAKRRDRNLRLRIALRNLRQRYDNKHPLEPKIANLQTRWDMLHLPRFITSVYHIMRPLFPFEVHLRMAGQPQHLSKLQQVDKWELTKTVVLEMQEDTHARDKEHPN